MYKQNSAVRTVVNNEEREQSNSALQEFRRTNLELFELILLFNEKLKNTTDIVIEPILIPDLNKSGFLEEALVDLMVIRMYRLYEIHPIIGKILSAEGDDCRKLLKILSSLWNTIKSNKKKIELWRNNVIAHSESQTKKYLPIHIVDKDYKTTIKSILLYSRLACWYYEVIYSNMKYLFDVAESTFETRYGKSDYVYFHEIWKSIEVEEKKVVNEFNKKLKQGGLATVLNPKF